MKIVLAGGLGIFRSKFKHFSLAKNSTFRHSNGEVQACFMFDKRGHTVFAFSTVGDDRVQFPMTKRFPGSNLLGTLGDGLVYRKFAMCLHGLYLLCLRTVRMPFAKRP